MSNTIRNQRRLVFHWLREGKIITDAWAKENGVGRLSARIGEVRKAVAILGLGFIKTIPKYDKGAYCGYQLILNN